MDNIVNILCPHNNSIMETAEVCVWICVTAADILISIIIVPLYKPFMYVTQRVKYKLLWPG